MISHEIGDWVLVRANVIDRDVNATTKGQTRISIKKVSNGPDATVWVSSDVVVERAKPPIPLEPKRTAFLKSRKDGWMFAHNPDRGWYVLDAHDGLFYTWEEVYNTHSPLDVFEPTRCVE